MECMVHRLDFGFMLSFERVLDNSLRTHVYSKVENPLYRRLRGESTRDTASRRTESATHYQLGHSPSPHPHLHVNQSVNQCTDQSQRGVEIHKIHMVTKKFLFFMHPLCLACT